ncbi:FKBP-type peptidyl-prolyl cis-trans isomerase [Thermocrispum municipale]|jgi:peptidylprolyl isomerase|uniref:FKBP-type peptidyl-prolyl cis-trans isomerase n=1 Tax=Thermocrispum municipale TaxID=37926 RepID=UPI00040FBF01|nr:FKBP-type peptidyl-prolyl cis-trans isomerase [Thermocrispum municipale]
MKNARAAAVLAAAGAMVALVACSPSKEQDSPLPPGTEPELTIDAPSSSAAPVADTGGEPCTIDDFTVEGRAGTKPEITVPDQPCAPPEKPLVDELDEGEGAAAKKGDEVSVDYVMVGVASGHEATNWTADGPESTQLEAGGSEEGWEDALVGMKPGARKLIVLNADQLADVEPSAFESGEAVAIVVGRSE